MSKLRLMYFWLSIAIVLPINSLAQGTYSLAPWPGNSILTQSTILSISISKEGFLWLGTLDGISRFDGSDISDFRSFKKDTEHIQSSQILSIIAGKNGNVFVTTKDAGLLIHDKEADSFKNFSCCNETSLDTGISASHIDKEGRIWLGYSNGIISVIAPRLHTVQLLEHISQSGITDFSNGSNGAVLAVSEDGEIYSIRRNEKSSTHISLSEHCQSELKNAKQIADIGNSKLLLGTRDNGLHIADIKNRSCRRVLLPGLDSSNPSNVNVKKIVYDQKVNLSLVATDQGLYILEEDTSINHFHVDNSSLANNEVTAIHPGDNGVYWIGTFTGLNYLTPTEIGSYQKDSDPRLHSIVAIASSVHHGLWVASYNGVMQLKPGWKSHHDLATALPSNTLTNTKIMSLQIDSNGMWIGYRSSGLEFHSFNSGAQQSFSTSSSPRLSSNSISAILTANSGQIFVGTHGGGLNIISKDRKSSVSVLPNNKIIMLYQTSDNSIWVGTESGLYRLSKDSKDFSKVEMAPLVSAKSGKPVIWAMAESPTGNLWFGTMHHGLLLWDRNSQKAHRLSSPHSINSSAGPISSVYAIQIDDLGHIWCSTNRGLVRIDPKTQESYMISSHHGLRQIEFDFGVSHKDENGLLYFGGSNGYIKFDPTRIGTLEPQPSLKLTGVGIAGEPENARKSKINFSRIQLTHKNYFITFTFSVLDFIDPDKNQFRYKLEGFDPNWIENGTRNTATYTNLPPGSYVLRVQGANSSGVWNRDGLSLDVEVLPPPWRSWWAYCLYMLATLLVAWMSKRAYDSYSIEKRAVQLAKEKYDVENKADDDMQEQLEAQDDLVRSAYVHNVATLSLISDLIARQNDYLPNGESRDAMEGNIERIACLSLLESCLYFQNDGLLADLNKYTNLITSRLLENAPVRRESITTINDIPSQLIPADIASPLSVAIFELLENAIQHAFDSESLANYIQLSIEKLPGDTPDQYGYRLTVRDNGIGIPENLQSNLDETSGLAIIQSITRRLSGSLHISCDDGTTIILDIPPSQKRS